MRVYVERIRGEPAGWKPYQDISSALASRSGSPIAPV